MSSQDVTLQVSVTLRLLDGPPVDNDWLLDALAATIGQQNGAMDKALRVSVRTDSDWDAPESVYIVYLVDEVGR